MGIRLSSTQNQRKFKGKTFILLACDEIQLLFSSLLLSMPNFLVEGLLPAYAVHFITHVSVLIRILNEIGPSINHLEIQEIHYY